MGGKLNSSSPESAPVRLTWLLPRDAGRGAGGEVRSQDQGDSLSEPSPACQTTKL